jgi:hypothetical protein
MDQKDELRELKGQIQNALQEEKTSEDPERNKELKNMLETLEEYEPEIKESWTPEDERLFAQKGKARVAHKPSSKTKSSTAQILPPQVSPVNDKLIQPARQSVDLWKGVIEKNYKADNK